MKTEIPDLSDLAIESPSSPSTPTSTDEPTVTFHPLKSREGVLVSVQPPEKLSNSMPGHVPCDIVLVIDVSSSMNTDAPAAVYDEQGKAAKEHFGLTVLDLTKHAAKTVVSSLNKGDRLGIVTFGYGSRIIQELTPMTKANKELVNERIDSMRADGATNLWGGIKDGFRLLESEAPSGRVPALMVLTDGQPNHGCPSKGYAKELRAMGTLPASINTFGFGYEIRSGLLKSIAETTHGNYAFIPDAGMIGTVFVHAVAHLMSTYATRCTLEITHSKWVLLQARAAMSSANVQPDDEVAQVQDRNKMTIHLGNLQYGQSRDIYLNHQVIDKKKLAYEVPEGEDSMIHATLTYSRMESAEYITFASEDLLAPSPLPQSVIAYHQSRAVICQLLKSLTSSFRPEDVQKRIASIDDEQWELQEAIKTIPARNYQDKYNQSLMQDLEGQVSEALSCVEYFNRWGRHFFFSLRNAHEKQLCNSFKDPGPLMYNDNPLFNEYRDNLDAAFARIPPPKPTGRLPVKKGGRAAHQSFTMAKFHSQGNPCFAAETPVLLPGGVEVPIWALRQGTKVETPRGVRKVMALLETHASPDTVMCRVGNLLVTPYHPIKIDRPETETTEGGSSSEWVFPADVADSTEKYSGPVYSVILMRDSDPATHDPETHAIRVGGGVWGVTLGHGITSGEDTRAHEFLGEWDSVLDACEALDFDEAGMYMCEGVRRDERTGRVNGFAPLCVPGF